jgi:hypothetical protein
MAFIYPPRVEKLSDSLLAQPREFGKCGYCTTALASRAKSYRSMAAGKFRNNDSAKSSASECHHRTVLRHCAQTCRTRGVARSAETQKLYGMEIVTHRTGAKLAVAEWNVIGTGRLMVASEAKHVFAIGIIDLAYFPVAAAAGPQTAEIVRTPSGLPPDAVWYFDAHRPACRIPFVSAHEPDGSAI